MELAVDLCDLEQNVLTRLDNRRGGTYVELGVNKGRRAFVPLSLEDPALGLVSAVDTLLRITLTGPEEFSLPLFIGRVLIPEKKHEPEAEELGIYAADALFSLERALARTVKGSAWEAVVFAATYQESIMWALVDAAEGHGVVEGDLTESVKRDRTYPPGKEVGQALIEMSEVIAGPDFEFEPVAGKGTATIAQFNTFYPRQGSDLTADVVFEFGGGAQTVTTFTNSPGGEEICNRFLAVGAPQDHEGESPYAIHPAYVAEHAASIAKYGPLERRESLDDVIETATLEAQAKAAVAGSAEPIPYFDFTAAPEQVEEEAVGSEGVPPRFGIDYWLGDTIGCNAYLSGPDEDPEEFTGRVTDAKVEERDSGQVAVKVSCAPEVSSEGVTGEAVTVKVPEGAE